MNFYDIDLLLALLKIVDEVVAEALLKHERIVAFTTNEHIVARASLQPVNVVEGLDSTLVMLQHKLKDGVEVVRDYEEDLPRIDAYAGELNQAWTNLIDNAVDALEGSGTLRVSTRDEDDAVVVEISDTGPGLEPEVASRAFDAFFTTKDVGKGTGLGLDIARRVVVERHNGTIDLVREGDVTVARIRLPR